MRGYLLLCTAAAFAPRPQRRPAALLQSSRNPVPPEDKPNRPPGIDPTQLPDASTAAAAGVRAAVENEELRRSRLQPALYTLLKV